MPTSSRKRSPNARIALCYIRKSWTVDEADLISPERQRAHIQAVCDTHGWIPEWYTDTEGHKSGMQEKNRPGWLALKARLNSPDVVAVVANDLARLHRKGWRVGDLIEYLDDRGIRLVLADPLRQMDFSTPQGRMLAQLSAYFDEWYAMDISVRVKSSIQHRKSKGITVGIPPFGTVRDKSGYLVRSNEGVWLMPDGQWVPGISSEPAPTEHAIWRGYADCAERILRLYAEKLLGRNKIAIIIQREGYAFRDRNGVPAPIQVEDILIEKPEQRRTIDGCQNNAFKLPNKKRTTCGKPIGKPKMQPPARATKRSGCMCRIIQLTRFVRSPGVSARV